MPVTLKDEIWQVLLQRIADDKCTPFLGAGACYGALPLGGQIANQWAEAHDFPLWNKGNLIEVAQYLAVRYDPIFPKRLFLDEFIKDAKRPNEPDEPHGILAQLPLSVYMTTNYDSFMMQALESHPFRKPRRAECRWIEASSDVVNDLPPDLRPDAANPLVFHLHGYSKPEYLVLTEDDYLRFLSNMARNPNLLPPKIKSALQGSSLVFIGYSLADWNFRLLFENLRAAFQYKSVAVMLPPGSTDKERERARVYLDAYYTKAFDLDIYWGTAREFCAELLQRWEQHKK